MSLKDLKNKISRRLRGSTLFQDKFGFENGIDITDDNAVLYRKNVVIKNIIFVVNIIYTIIFTIIAIGDPTNSSNWLLTVLLFPVTALVNYFLGNLIKKGPEDKLSQVMAMYVAAFYLFLSSVLVYIKLKYGEVEVDGVENSKNYLAEAGYILIYIALLVCAFYQNKKMLKNIFIWLMVLITILHFTVTYGVVQMVSGTSSVWDSIVMIVKGTYLRDILIRTILLGVYMLILYVYVSMTNYMQEERKKEQARRREVQENYISSVKNIFELTIPKYTVTEDDKRENLILCNMVRKLGSNLSMKPDEIEDMVSYTELYINNSFDLGMTENQNTDESFEAVKNSTAMGEKLIARFELERKSEEILRHVLDNNISDDDFIKEMRDSIKDMQSQIIIICEIYISMRSVRAYKKAYNHKNTMATMEKSFKVFFDSLVFDRFLRFDTDFEAIFDEE